MKYDKNQIIGYSLLGVLIALFFYYSAREQEAYRQAQLTRRDSSSGVRVPHSLSPRVDQPANRPAGLLGGEQIQRFDTVRTSDLTVVFTNKGAAIYAVTLHKYNNHAQKHFVRLIEKGELSFSYGLRVSPERSQESKDIFFSPPLVERFAHQTRLTYTAEDRSGRSVKHTYTIKDSSYLIDFDVAVTQAQHLLDHNLLNVQWEVALRQQEKGIEYERGKAQVCVFDEHGSFDYFNLGSGIEEKCKGAQRWVCVRQQFFNVTLLSHSAPMRNVEIESTPGQPSSTVIMDNKVRLLQDLDSAHHAHFQWYVGPNDYRILSTIGGELNLIVDIGQGVFAFAKYINKALIMPVFDLLAKFVPNYGIVILLLTIFVRIITTPLVYSGYKSAAKMRLLQPDIEKLKQKYPDEQTLTLKRMELYRDAGANPLQGCLPILLQIPIFLSLFYFFNSCIALREQAFWWSDDLASYDSIWDLGVNIPIYGDHVSLFTILNVLTSFLATFANRNASMDQSNPMMKYLPYFMPVVFLGLFNSMPAALTWYYTVSNIITVLLQVVIQRFVINHDKLLLQIQQKRKQPKKKSAWMLKAEQLQRERMNRRK